MSGGRVGVTVFGSSEPLPGEPRYEEAYRVGRLLALAGRSVITGGYGGVMEAASRGAVEAGGRTIGVTCRVFAERRPNAFVGEERPAVDLYERTRELVRLALGFVVLEGKAGTLAELGFLWALHRAGCLSDRPVVLLGGGFAPLLEQLKRNQMLDPPQLRLNRLARDPAEAVRLLEQALGGRGAGR